MRVLIGAALSLALSTVLLAGGWSAPARAEARDGRVLVTCRSMLAGEFLVVELEPAAGWHVYAMDNEARAKRALAGKMSLGVEQNTQVIVTGGLQPVGGWYQSEPLDFSQPELRWYSYGFDGRSLFATKVRRGEEPWAKVTVRAQACDSASCVSVEAEMELSFDGEVGAEFTPAGLVLVGGF